MVHPARAWPCESQDQSLEPPFEGPNHFSDPLVAKAHATLAACAKAATQQQLTGCSPNFALLSVDLGNVVLQQKQMETPSTMRAAMANLHQAAAASSACRLLRLEGCFFAWWLHFLAGFTAGRNKACRPIKWQSIEIKLVQPTCDFQLTEPYWQPEPKRRRQKQSRALANTGTPRVGEPTTCVIFLCASCTGNT